jgi:hypothetical protein
MQAPGVAAQYITILLPGLDSPSAPSLASRSLIGRRHASAGADAPPPPGKQQGGAAAAGRPGGGGRHRRRGRRGRVPRGGGRGRRRAAGVVGRRVPPRLRPPLDGAGRPRARVHPAHRLPRAPLLRRRRELELADGERRLRGRAAAAAGRCGRPNVARARAVRIMYYTEYFYINFTWGWECIYMLHNLIFQWTGNMYRNIDGFGLKK